METEGLLQRSLQPDRDWLKVRQVGIKRKIGVNALSKDFSVCKNNSLVPIKSTDFE